MSGGRTMGRPRGSKNAVPYVRFNPTLRLELHVDRSGPVTARGEPCWRWIGGSRTKGGYVRITAGGRGVMAHRWAYELLVGPIPEGLTIDHLCRVTDCVNPAHLEAVTQRTNIVRGDGPAARNVVKTHCPQGHPYDETNTYRRPDGGRDCKLCINERSRRRNERRRARLSGATS